jgi:hypothetical protein
MPDSKQLLKFCWLLLALSFSMSAAAAQSTFVTDLSVIPLGAVLVAVGISITGGAGATLAKISSTKVKIDNLWVVVLSDMVLSLVAGLAAFFACAAWEIAPFKAALAILIAGYGNARVLERILSAGISQISQRTGTTEPTP